MSTSPRFAQTRLRPWVWSSLLALAAPAPLAAQADPTPPPGVTEEELRLLQGALGASTAPPPAPTPAPSAPAVAARVLQDMNPDIALILDTAGAWFSQPENLQSGAHDPTRTGFNLQQLEMSIGANVDPFFRMDANLVFSQFGVEVEEAYATTLSLPANLQVRAGQFLTRFGRINPTHPHAWSFVDQPFVIGRYFGSEGNRGLGAELSWLSPLPWYAELVASATDAAGECCARSYFGGDDLGVRGPGDILYTTALKQFFGFTPDLSLMWGLSAQLGPNASGNGNRTEIYGTDVYLRFRPVNSPVRRTLSLQAELMHRRRQVPYALLTDTSGYAQVVFNANIRWETGARVDWGTGQEDDPLDPDWTGLRHRESAQLTFYPSHFSRLRLEGSMDHPSWTDTPVYATFLALEVLIGAHGAHEF